MNNGVNGHTLSWSFYENNKVAISSQKFIYYPDEECHPDKGFYCIWRHTVNRGIIDIGDLLMDFLVYNFLLFDDFIKFVEDYGLSGLYDFSKTLRERNSLDVSGKTHRSSFTAKQKEDFINNVWAESREMLSRIQKYFELKVHYCLELESESDEWLNGLNSKQRYFLLDSHEIMEKLNNLLSNDEIKKYTASNSGFGTYSPLLGKTKVKNTPTTIEDTANLIRNMNFIAYENYYSTNLISLLNAEFVEMVKRDTPVRKCGYCRKYFIPKNKVDTYFCDRVMESSNGIKKTCKDLGPKARYREKLKDDKCTVEYNKKYRMLYGRASSSRGKKRISWAEFDIWRNEAKKELDIARNGSEQEKEKYLKWLNNSSKMEWFIKLRESEGKEG